MNQLISEEYRKQCALLHNSGVWGSTSHLMATRIEPLIRASGSKDYLDYGAGRCTLSESPCLSEFKAYEYDPAVPAISAIPEPRDFVVCTDVLEHIERDLIHNVMADLKRVVKKEGYFIVALVPALQILPDGRNAHILIETHEWWKELISEYFEIKSWKPYRLNKAGQVHFPLADWPYGKVDVHVTPKD